MIRRSTPDDPILRLPWRTRSNSPLLIRAVCGPGSLRSLPRTGILPPLTSRHPSPPQICVQVTRQLAMESKLGPANFASTAFYDKAPAFTSVAYNYLRHMASTPSIQRRSSDEDASIVDLTERVHPPLPIAWRENVVAAMGLKGSISTGGFTEVHRTLSRPKSTRTLEPGTVGGTSTS